jgi:hypothetical protein
MDASEWDSPSVKVWWSCAVISESKNLYLQVKKIKKTILAMNGGEVYDAG